VLGALIGRAETPSGVPHPLTAAAIRAEAKHQRFRGLLYIDNRRGGEPRSTQGFFFKTCI